MSQHTVRVDNGKYTFSLNGPGVMILRHDQPWLILDAGCNAIHAMMCELDAARVVVEAARAYARGHTEPSLLMEALKQHDALVSDREPPSEWTK